MKHLFLKPFAAMLACGLIATPFTACTDDDEDDTIEIQEKFNLDYLTAKANNDGTVTISGTVTTNKALAKFILTSKNQVDEDGNPVEYDLMNDVSRDGHP